MKSMNSKHLFFILTGLSLVSMKTYPTILTQTSGKDAWIAVIVSSIIILIIFTYFLSICKKYDCFNLVTIYRSSLGKYLGNFFIFLLIISLILTLIECSSLEISIIHTNFLIETPYWYLLTFFILPCLYTVKKRPMSILITTIITTVIIIISGINLFILTEKYRNFEYLFPVLVNGLNLNFLLSIIKSLGLSGIILITILYMKDIENKDKIIKNSFLSMIFITQVQIIAMMSVIATFEIKRLNTLFYPKVLQTQLISYFGSLESGEFYVMIKFIGGWFIKYILVFDCILRILEELKMSNNKTIYIITGVVFFTSLFIARNILNLFKLINYYTYISFINFILIPFIVFTIFLFKKINESKKRV